MAYKSIYKPINTQKCINSERGEKITTRSLWERAVAKWCDGNKSVLRWGVETVVVPYICRTDNQRHRYFVDFYVEMQNGNKLLIEVKPEIQTIQPESKQSKTKRKFLKEVMTYSKNISKWEAANAYAAERNWIFEVWTENHLRKLGMKIV